MSIKTELKGFCRSFVYAGRGIIHCVRTQRNMRFHIGAAGAVAGLSAICSVSVSEALVLLVTIGSVMALECVNTAIENAADLACGEKRSKKAGAAKDCAAGAVLSFCVAAVGVAILVFGRRYSQIVAFFMDKPYAAAAAGVYAVLWFIWVFCLFTKDEKKAAKIKRRKNSTE